MPESPDLRWSAALEGLDLAGAGAGTPVVVRDGGALLVRRSATVVRVRPQRGGLDVARREVDVSKALVRAGVPVTELVGDDQPWSMGEFIVTAWRWTDAEGAAGPGQIGGLARALREATANTQESHPVCDPLKAIVDSVAHLSAGDGEAEYVRQRADELRQSWPDATAEDPLGRSLVHGDLHAGNVVVGPSGPLLTDLELTGYGPPSYDAAPAMVAVRRYGALPEGLETFIESFGSDPRLWSGFETLVSAYELWGAAWAVGVRHLEASWATEATRRVESLRDGADHRWHLS